MGSIGFLDAAIRHIPRMAFAKPYAALNGERLPGRPEQHIGQISEDPNFVIGSRRAVGMTVYHYAKMLAGVAVDSLVKQTNGLCSPFIQVEPQRVAAIVPAGSLTLQVVHGTAVAHEWQNGRINVFPTPPLRMQVYDIVDNDVNDGTNTRLYLRTPVVEELAAAGLDSSIVPSIYRGVVHPNDLAAGVIAPFVGVPNMFVTAGYYFWLATHGLVQLGQGEPLNSIGGPEVYFNPATGFVHKRATVQALGADQNWQRAGYMAIALDTGDPDIDCSVWLQLDP